MPIFHVQELPHEIVVGLILVVKNALYHHNTVNTETLIEDASELAVVYVTLLGLIT